MAVASGVVAVPKVDSYLEVSRTKRCSNPYDISASSRIQRADQPEGAQCDLGDAADRNGVVDLVGDDVEQGPGGDGLGAGQVPDLADGPLVGAESGQAGSDVGHVAVAVRQVGVTEEVGALAGDSVAEDPCAEAGFGDSGTEEVGGTSDRDASPGGVLGCEKLCGHRDRPDRHAQLGRT